MSSSDEKRPISREAERLRQYRERKKYGSTSINDVGEQVSIHLTGIYHFSMFYILLFIICLRFQKKPALNPNEIAKRRNQADRSRRYRERKKLKMMELNRSDCDLVHTFHFASLAICQLGSDNETSVDD